VNYERKKRDCFCETPYTTTAAAAPSKHVHVLDVAISSDLSLDWTSMSAMFVQSDLSGTHCPMIFGIRSVLQTLLVDSCWKRSCYCRISVSNALEYYQYCTMFGCRFQDRTPQGNDREGHVWGGVMKPREDGFTRSTSLHSHGPEINTTTTLRNIEPYVARYCC